MNLHFEINGLICGVNSDIYSLFFSFCTLLSIFFITSVVLLRLPCCFIWCRICLLVMVLNIIIHYNLTASLSWHVHVLDWHHHYFFFLILCASINHLRLLLFILLSSGLCSGSLRGVRIAQACLLKVERWWDDFVWNEEWLLRCRWILGWGSFILLSNSSSSDRLF